MSRHLRVATEGDVPGDDNAASKAALTQIGSRVTPGQWDTPEAVALFETMVTLERTTPLSLNEMEAHLGMPGVADALLEWEAGS